jgi:hypothetical protein
MRITIITALKALLPAAYLITKAIDWTPSAGQY